MSEDDSELDPTLRRNLAALFGEPPLSLDDDAERRVIAAAQHESRRLDRARRMRRMLVSAGGAVLAAAALLLVWLNTRAHHEVAAVARVEQRACALPFGPSAPTFTRTQSGRQTLSLGSLGQLFAEPGAELEVERSSACELSLLLKTGALGGDLSNLRPAVLRIRTPLGEVVVRGTRFSVEADGGLEVVLVSGSVDVLSPDQKTIHLVAGTLLKKASTREGAQVTALLPEHAHKLDQLLTTDPVDPAPVKRDAGAPSSPRVQTQVVKTTAELLSAAEAERRRGRLVEARALYREAGGRSDENAEVALLRWARLELDTADASAARALIERYQRRFPQGRLSTEAAWLEVRALSAQGKQGEARDAAKRLIARFPATPQAQAARQLLNAP